MNINPHQSFTDLLDEYLATSPYTFTLVKGAGLTPAEFEAAVKRHQDVKDKLNLYVINILKEIKGL